MAVLYFYHRGRSDFLRQCLRNVRESCWDPKRKCCVTKSVLGFQQCMKNEWRKCRRRHATQRNVIEIKWVLLDSRDRSIITEMENQIARSNTKERKSVLLLFAQEKEHRNGYFKPKSNFIISRDQGNFLKWAKIQLTELFCQIIYTIAPAIIYWLWHWVEKVIQAKS